MAKRKPRKFLPIRDWLAAGALFLVFSSIFLLIGPVYGQTEKSALERYLQTLSESERKEYFDLKTDWEKRQRADPEGFKKLQVKMTLQAQMTLGRFGYGTLFTGALDARTQEALHVYQTSKGLPVTGQLNPITFYCLTRDDEIADRRITGLSTYSFGWYDHYFSASGAWDGLNSSEDILQSTELECFKDQSMCIEGDAVQTKVFGLFAITAKLTEFSITKWDKFEIVAEDATPLCERDQLLINRQEKSVSLVSTPTYKSESCSKTLGKPETVTYHLVDGAKISGQRVEATQKMRSSFYKLSDNAKNLLKEKN